MVVEIDGLIERFEAVNLQELDKARLLNRVDTKFLLCEGSMHAVLADMAPQYDALSIEDKRFSRYHTVYFDTPDFALYNQHHNDRANRYKVRCRKYVETGISFLEVKQKTNKRRTVKNRLEIPELPTRFNSSSMAFLDYHYPMQTHILEPVIWNRFRRATLVSKCRSERATIDLDLTYGWGVKEGCLTSVGIVEVKQAKFNPDSPLVHRLRAEGVRPMGFSKYCAAMMEIYPYLKRNRFKRRSLLIDHLQHQRGSQ